MIDKYLLDRAAGAPAVAGNRLNYANPEESDHKSLAWRGGIQDGMRLGRQLYGTSQDNVLFRPEEFGLDLPEDYYPAQP